MLVIVAFAFAPGCRESSPAAQPDAAASATTPPPAIAPIESNKAPAASASAVIDAGLDRRWLGRWHAGLTAYTEIAGRSFPGPIHGREITLEIHADGRFLFHVRECAFSGFRCVPGEEAACDIEARFVRRGSVAELIEERTTCAGRGLVPRKHKAKIYLSGPCILKLEMDPGPAGMGDFAVIRPGCGEGGGKKGDGAGF